MNITLINPPSSLDMKTLPHTGDIPPLGLMNLASVLEDEGYNVKIIDASVNRFNIEETAHAALKNSPKIIGITSLTSTYHIVKEIAKILKLKINAKIVLGGMHATTMTEQCVKSKLFDYVVSGEGEVSFPLLIEAIEKHKNKNIPGINYCNNGKNIFNKEKFIRDITKFRIRAWQLIDIKKYNPAYASYSVLPAISTMISRGCPNNCVFCASKAMFKCTFRPHSEKQIIKELTLLKERGIKDINFVDINFSSNRQHTIKVSKFLGEFGFKWNITTRCDCVDLELLKIMKSNGCYQIGYGIEAGTQEDLDKIKKNYTLDLVRKCIKETKKVGINTKCYFSIGYPWQTKQHIKKTIEFAKELNPHIVTFSIITPYPGSELFNKVKRRLINSDFIDMTHRSAKYSVSKYFNEKEIIQIMNKAYTKFYMQPKHIIQSLGSIKSFRDLNNMIRAIKFIVS